MMISHTKKFFASLAIALFTYGAHAASISYSTTFLGGTSWQYDYKIENSGPHVAFDEITIYFPLGSFQNLSSTLTPSDWDPFVAQPDAGVPADGYLDVLSLSGPVPDFAVIAGFSIQFEYLGVGAPGPQSFELIDSTDFSLVGSGRTILAVPPSPGGQVPEPNSLLLVAGAGLAGVVALGRQRRRDTGSGSRFPARKSGGSN